MRVSTSGELVKGEVGQVALRRSGRLWGPARRSVASGPDLRSANALVLLAAVLVAALPVGAAAVPGPDPHPSAGQQAGTPTPDPAPAKRQTATPGPATDVASGSSTYGTSAEPSPPATTSVERPRAAKPAPRPRTTAKPKAKARTKAKAAGPRLPTPTVRRGENEPVRVAARSTAAVSVARSATDPMVLGAFALLTLALSSAGLLLVLLRSERSGVRA